jgi:hypothetical protein
MRVCGFAVLLAKFWLPFVLVKLGNPIFNAKKRIILPIAVIAEDDTFC